jgi:hypothetical protein
MKRAKAINLTVPIAQIPIARGRLGDRVPEEKQATDLVCYCFGHTRRAIEQDFIQNGRSLILEMIT